MICLYLFQILPVLWNFQWILMHGYVTVFNLNEHFLNKKWNKISVLLQICVGYWFTYKQSESTVSCLANISWNGYPEIHWRMWSAFVQSECTFQVFRNYNKIHVNWQKQRWRVSKKTNVCQVLNIFANLSLWYYTQQKNFFSNCNT
jgi:hypothetical protein